MRESKLRCILNLDGGAAGHQAVAHLVEAQLGDFDFWYGVLDLCLPSRVVHGLLGGNVFLRFEDGREGIAAAIKMSHGTSGLFHGVAAETEENTLLSFAGIAALTQPAPAKHGEPAGV